MVQRAVAGDDGGVLCRQVQRRREEESPLQGSCGAGELHLPLLKMGMRCASGMVRRSTVHDTEAIRLLENSSDFGELLVPRGGIEPPTRGFSVPSNPSRRVELPSVDVRQAHVKTRQGRYAEARSSTVADPKSAANPDVDAMPLVAINTLFEIICAPRFKSAAAPPPPSPFLGTVEVGLPSLRNAFVTPTPTPRWRGGWR